MINLFYQRIGMSSSLHTITALALIFGGIGVGVYSLDRYMYEYQNDQATQTIITAMAQECRALKKREGLNDTFEETSGAVSQLLDKGINVLSEKNYLQLIALCMVTNVNKEKI